MLLATIATTFCVFAILAFTAYAFVRPFTHVHYKHPKGKLWWPLD